LLLLLRPAAKYEEVHAFSDFANWLIPGKLLVGRYPYVEPSRCKTYEEGEQHLQEILKAGITSFISLQVGTWPM
jgi:alanine transaminase